MSPSKPSMSHTRAGSQSSDEIHTRPPLQVVSTCLEPTVSLLQRRSPHDILSLIPHPDSYPFFDYFSVSSRYIEQQYRQLLDIHEILCVEEVVQNIRQDERPFPRFHDAKDIASMLARKANEGLAYIEKHCRESGIKINLRTIRSQHQPSFENIHPYNILLPYIRSQNLSNDQEDTYSTQT